LENAGETTITETELQALIDFFDVDKNGRLNETEFTHLILPCENNELRQQVQEREGDIEKDENGKINVDIENGLVKIIAREIELQRTLEDIKGQLRGCSSLDSFHMVDNFEGSIKAENLEAFLKSCGHEPTDLELLAIIRRMDADGDATITYSGWADFLRPNPALAKAEPLAPWTPYYSSWRYRHCDWPYSSSYYHSPYLSSWRYRSLDWGYSRPYYPAYSSWYRPHYSTYVAPAPAYVPPAPAYVAPAPAYFPPARTVWPSVSYTAPRYTHTTYEAAGTVTDYVPTTVTTHEPVTTYHTRVVPDYKLVTERTEYVTTPVRTTVTHSPYHYGYSSAYNYGYSSACNYGYSSSYNYGWSSPYHSRYHW